MNRRTVMADGKIACGARVLVRGMRAVAASDALANATAGHRPSWDLRRSKAYRKGETLLVVMDDGIGSRDLHAIANGPIMDPAAIYLPAGKLSMSDYRAREVRRLSGEPA